VDSGTVLVARSSVDKCLVQTTVSDAVLRNEVSTHLTGPTAVPFARRELPSSRERRGFFS
jgi:hypothetical protein